MSQLICTKGNSLIRFSVLSRFPCFSPATGSHHTNLLNIRHVRTLLRTHKGSSSNTGTGFLLLGLKLSHFSLSHGPMSSSFHHPPHRPRHWSPPNTFLHFSCNLDTYTMPFWTQPFQGLCLTQMPPPIRSLPWGPSVGLLPALSLPLLPDPFWFLFILVSGTLLVLSALLDFGLLKTFIF